MPDWNPLVYVLPLLVTIFAFCALGKWSPQFPDLKKRGQGEFLAGQTFASLLFILLLAAVGFSYAAYRADLRLSVSLADEWEGRDIELTGVIASLPQENERGVRFEFDVEMYLANSASCYLVTCSTT